MMALPLTSGALSLTIVAMVMSFGNGIGSGIMMTLGADAAPPIGRIKFLGIWRVLSDSGNAAGPVLMSVVASAFTLAIGIVSIGSVGLLAATALAIWVPHYSPYALRGRSLHAGHDEPFSGDSPVSHSNRCAGTMLAHIWRAYSLSQDRRTLRGGVTAGGKRVRFKIVGCRIGYATLILAVGAPAAEAGTSVSFAATSSGDSANSTDWSGWDVTGGTYKSVAASWTVPAVSCSTAETSYSADWVGLDGDGSSSVEQIGTSSDCDTGTAAYSAWYEFYPSVAVVLPNTVKAGDKISASVVAVPGSDEFKLTLTDSTQKWTKTETGESPSGTGASAEIIAEAPSGSGRANSVLPLADFKTVTFSDVLVNSEQVGNLANVAKIAMVDSSGNPMATVSALTGEDEFTVTWVSSGDSGYAEQTSGGQGSTGGQGRVVRACPSRAVPDLGRLRIRRRLRVRFGIGWRLGWLGRLGLPVRVGSGSASGGFGSGYGDGLGYGFSLSSLSDSGESFGQA